VTFVRAAARVAAKELRDVLRERSIAIALLVQFFIAAFSAGLSVGLLALYDPGSVQSHLRADVAYTGPGGFDAELLGTSNLRLVRVADAATALSQFQAGRYAAVVQEQAPDGANGTRRVTLLLPDGQVESTLLVTQMKGLLQDYELQLRNARQGRLEHTILSLPGGPAAAPPYAFLHATLVPLLLLTPVFLSGAIAADALSQELQARTFVLLRSAPASLGALLTGKLAVPVLLAPAQFLLWVGLLRLNGIAVGNVGILAGLAAGLTLLLAGIGFALAARRRRDGPTQASYAFVALALAAASLLLPRDPLNLVAVLSAGRLDPVSWTTLGILAVAAMLAAVLGVGDAARGIRRRPD